MGTICKCVIIAAILLIGCGKPAKTNPVAQQNPPRYKQLIFQIEQGKYTTYRSQPHVVLVKEVQELFDYKEAYPWLIRALDSKDEYIACTVSYHFDTLRVPESRTSAALLKWYSVPENQLFWNGYMWVPKTTMTVKPKE
jgi:hypothetical protein